jgi:uncharacterized protein YdhG (YjbR/CyaY superfamily)
VGSKKVKYQPVRSITVGEPLDQYISLDRDKDMPTKTNKPDTIDEYIAEFSPDVQMILNKIRNVITETAPEAQERISYGMPGFYQGGMLVWFGGHKDHIGFYPTGEGIEAFKDQLSGYKTSKGAVQFPLERPIPYELIRKMVRHRVEENLRKK